LEQDRIEGRLEIVIGDELEDTPSALRHLGPLRGFCDTAQVTIRYDLNHIPLGVGVKGFLDVRGIEQLQHGLEVVSRLDSQCEDVAVGRAVQRITQYT
jgi:hypothetical protein